LHYEVDPDAREHPLPEKDYSKNFAYNPSTQDKDVF
jgi:hypothetical protein